ncbi:MAG: hypothetical protein ING41_15810 [Burkholderiales bacterium]|nr:hypothetical protein [Burkholderiales bacterium]
MPERKIVSPSQLNAWLTAQIQEVDGCRDCDLTWKYRLREPQKHGGCNWSELNLRYGEGTDHDTAVKAALTIEREAFKQFNLEPESSPPPLAAPEFKANMLPRLLRVPTFHLDANLINARRNLDAVNCMEHWRDTGVILLVMAGIAHEEAQAGAGGNAEARKRKAAGHIYTINDDGDAKADDTYARVEAILWGRATDRNQAHDVEVVCEAIKWHAILVTRDGGSKEQPAGILGNRDRLREQFDVRILRPEEAVEFIRGKLAERDEFNAQVAALTSAPLPEWTRRD